MKRYSFIIIASLLFYGAEAQVPSDSLVYENQTVTAPVKIVTHSHVRLSSDSILSTGRLEVKSRKGITITGGFSVQLGGVLSLDTNRGSHIRYTYDETGNRTSRRKNE